MKRTSPFRLPRSAPVLPKHPPPRVLASERPAPARWRPPTRPCDSPTTRGTRGGLTHVVATRALRGDVPEALADFSAALECQRENDPYAANKPLYSFYGIYFANILGSLGRREEATQLTNANRELCSELFGDNDIVTPQCQLVLSSLSIERSGSLSTAAVSFADLWPQARDWALARDAKEVLCWSCLVEAQHALAQYKHEAKQQSVPKGRQHVAPGVSPGLGEPDDSESSEGATADATDVIAPSGLAVDRATDTPGSRPGLHATAASRLRSDDPSLALRACLAALESGLKIARDCGYGLYHIDLLLERARLHLLRGDVGAALHDVEVALGDEAGGGGIPANEAAGQPELLAARHPACGYAWPVPFGLQLRAEALLLQAAQLLECSDLSELSLSSDSEQKEIESGDKSPHSKDREPDANALRLIEKAKSCLNEALELWQPLHDPEPERDDQNFKLDGKQYNYKAAETHRVLSELEAGVLTRYPFKSIEHSATTSDDTEDTMKKTIVSIDLVGYSTVCAMLEDAIGATAIPQLHDQIQTLIDAGLEAIKVDRSDAVNKTTGDGAILVLDRPSDVHRLAEAVHEAARNLNRTKKELIGKRVFRIGAATGDVDMTPADRDEDIAGMAIARAVRLEGKATAGGILVDEPTFDELTATQKKRYAAKESVRGKRSEVFDAYRCVMGPDAKAVADEFAGTGGNEQSQPVPARSGVGQKALETWLEKLDYLLDQESIVSDAAQKFTLRKQIEEAETKIRELGG